MRLSERLKDPQSGAVRPALQGLDVTECLGPVELGGFEVRQPDRAVETLVAHVEQRLPVDLDLDAVLCRPVHLHEVDRVGAEPLERRQHLFAQRLGVSGRDGLIGTNGRLDRAALGKHVGAIGV